MYHIIVECLITLNQAGGHQGQKVKDRGLHAQHKNQLNTKYNTDTYPAGEIP